MKSTTISLLSAILCAVLAAGCGGTGQNGLPAVQAPSLRAGVGPQQGDRNERPGAPIVGVYVGQSQGAMLEYSYTGKGSPLCTLSIPNESGNIQSDSKNGLIVPEYSGSGGGVVAIYNEGKTGRSCLPSSPIATFAVPGDPLDAFSLDGKVYDVALTSASGLGVAVCYQTRQRPGCRRVLQVPAGGGGTNAPVGIWGVTADATGVYASVEYPAFFGNTFALVYWKGGVGTGTFVNGFSDSNFGTISFDGLHNLLAMDGSNLYVYSGCPSACTQHGPFPLHSISHMGSLGNGDTRFMTLESVIGPGEQIDVYQYNGTSGITYLYSNQNGFNASSIAVGIAQRLN